MSNKNLGKLFSKIIFCGLCVSSIACLAQEDSLKEELSSENIVTEEIEKQEEPIKEESSSENIVTEQIEKQEETIKIMSIYTWDDFTKEKNCQSFTKEIGQHDDLRELYQLLKQWECP